MNRPNLYLVMLHLGGNAALLWLGYYWLGISEARTLSLLWSALIALVLLVGACWLHGAAFLSGQDSDLPRAFRTALRHLLPVVAGVVVIIVVYALLARWTDYLSGPGFRLASYLTLKFRKPVKPASVLRVFSVVMWLVRWVLVPVFALPWISGIAVHGWRGFAPKLPKLLYVIETPILLLCALWLPLKVINWVPAVGGFTLEILSFSVRLLLAYLLFVGAWLVLVRLTSSGKLVPSQARTLASP